jgi:hypothetical protein
MGMPFLLGNLTLFIVFVYAVLLRWEVEMRRAQTALPDEPEGLAP